jgi:hypothetical protein
VGSSVKRHDVNDKLKDELIGRTRQVWQPRIGHDLSREEARQISEKVTGFFSILAEWAQAEKPAKEAGEPDASRQGRRTLVLADGSRTWIGRLPAVEVKPQKTKKKHARRGPR